MVDEGRADRRTFHDLLRLRHRELYHHTKEQKRNKAKTHEIISLCLGLSGQVLSGCRDADWLLSDRWRGNPFATHFRGTRRHPARLRLHLVTLRCVTSCRLLRLERCLG